MNKTVEQAVDHYQGEFPHGLGEDAVIVWVDENKMDWAVPGFQAVGESALMHDGVELVCTRDEFMKAAAQWRAKQGKEWVDGLPPVGAECEVLWIGEWHQTKIIGYDDGLPVFKSDWEDRYAYACGADARFRPIQSDRDKAIEEMVSIRPNIYGTDEEMIRAFAAWIYDEGYRKQISRGEARQLLIDALDYKNPRVEPLLDALGY